ncbi:MAG: bifunctional diaminohydroxyphosphoribosylaminopyrimidine deaminase/5-amino-6-(5-phosphoribosylamino)uracil reductase [Spirochaetota bacterium]
MIPSISEEIRQNILKHLVQLSFQATGLSSPNPPVACVITDLQGKILSFAHTDRVGGLHAERRAYQNSSVPLLPNQHIVYVTLEPCSHTGRTPPCIDIILQHQPKALVYGVRDPNPLLRARDGLQELQQAGIHVQQDAELTSIAESFLYPFFSRIQKNRINFIIKSSMSKEGNYAPTPRQRYALSAPESFAFADTLRAKVDAVLVGPGTVAYDSPRLNYRHKSTPAIEIRTQKNYFWESLLATTEQSLADETLYQPYRVFLLARPFVGIDEFVHKQEELNHRYSHKKCIFFLYSEYWQQWQEWLEKLANLSECEPIACMQESLYDTITNHLQESGVNLLLVEGGNSLYTAFSQRMMAEDQILWIKTQAKLENGIAPNIQTPIQLFASYAVGFDTWEIYKASTAKEN